MHPLLLIKILYTPTFTLNQSSTPFDDKLQLPKHHIFFAQVRLEPQDMLDEMDNLGETAGDLDQLESLEPPGRLVEGLNQASQELLVQSVLLDTLDSRDHLAALGELGLWVRLDRQEPLVSEDSQGGKWVRLGSQELKDHVVQLGQQVIVREVPRVLKVLLEPLGPLLLGRGMTEALVVMEPQVLLVDVDKGDNVGKLDLQDLWDQGVPLVHQVQEVLMVPQEPLDQEVLMGSVLDPGVLRVHQELQAAGMGVQV